MQTPDAAIIRHIPPSVGFPDEWEVVVGDEIISVESSQEMAEAFARGYNVVRQSRSKSRPFPTNSTPPVTVLR